VTAVADLEKFVQNESRLLIVRAFVVQETLESKGQTAEQRCLNDLRLALEWAAHNKPSFQEAKEEEARQSEPETDAKPGAPPRWSI